MPNSRRTWITGTLTYLRRTRTGLLIAKEPLRDTQGLTGAAEGSTYESVARTTLLPGTPTLRRRLTFLVVNACTVVNLLLGLSAVLLVTRGEMPWAALCVIGCIVADSLDGALARQFGVTSPFGSQMDSLADLCAFGVVAPLLACLWLLEATPLYVAFPACALLAVCAMIRLARFNVAPKDARFFVGLPAAVPAAVTALGLLLDVEPMVAYTAPIAVLALLMVSNLPYAKSDRIFALPWWIWVLPPLTLLLFGPIAAFVLVALGYVLSGPLVRLKAWRDTASSLSAQA